MDKSEIELQKKLLFWGLIGPFLILLSISLSSLKPSSLQEILSFSAIFGLLLSVAFDWKGAISASALFCLIVFTQIGDMNFNEMIWTFGLTFSYILSFFISSFSSKEAIQLIYAMQIESKSRLENIWRLDEKLKDMLKSQEDERRQLGTRLEESRKDLSTIKKQEEINYSIIQDHKKEIASLKELMEKQEFQLRQEREKNGALASEVKDLESLIESMEGGGPETSSLLTEFEKTLAENNRIKEELKLLHDHFNEEMSLHNNVIAGLRSELDSFIKESAKKEEEELRHQRMIHELGEHAELLINEKTLLETALNKLEEDLIKEKASKNDFANEQEQLSNALKKKEEEISELHFKNDELAAQFENKEAILRQLVQEGQARVQKLEKEIKDSKQRAKDPEIERQEFEALAKKSEKLQNENLSLSTALKESETEKREAIEEKMSLASKLSEMETLKHQLEKEIEEFTKFREESAQTKTELDLLKAEFDSLSSLYEELSKTQESVIVEKESFVSKLSEMETLKHQLEKEIEEFTKFREDSAQTKTELVLLKAEFDSLNSLYEELSKTQESVIIEKESLVSKLSEMEILKQQLEKEIEELTKFREESVQTKTEFELLKAEFDSLNSLYEELSKTQNAEDGKVKEVLPTKKAQQLMKEKEKLQLAVQELKKKRKQDLLQNKKTEGMLKQMKQQFEEKAATLDETRRALFHMQEKVLAFQREKEMQKEDRSEVENLLEEQIAQLEKERKTLIQEHQDEVEALHDIIETLTSKESAEALA